MKPDEGGNVEDGGILKAMKDIRYKIAVLSGKGGVGKTTVAVNLACALSAKYKVGLLDTDITGPNVPKMLGIEDEKPGASQKGIEPVLSPQGIKVMSMAFLLSTKDTPVIWRGPIKMGAIRQFLGEVAWGELDYLIMDLPPGTGDEPLSIAQLIPDLDGAIIVTTPQDVALLDSKKAINFIKRLNIPLLGVIENMAGLECPHCKKQIELFKIGGGEKAAKEMDIPFLGRIPIQPEIVESGDKGKPFITEFSETEASKAFKCVVENLEKKIKKGGEKDGR
ncbi:MAG: Mrp/NBP35 family ATP-binding protein [Candidatus Altiarchaeota archaeon]